MFSTIECAAVRLLVHASCLLAKEVLIVDVFDGVLLLCGIDIVFKIHAKFATIAGLERNYC